MSSPYEKLPRIPRYNEIVAKITRRYRKLLEGTRGKIRGAKKARAHEINKLNTVYNIASEELKKIVYGLPFVDYIHPFYRDLLDVLIGYKDYKSAVTRLARALKLIDKIYKEYLELVKTAPTLHEAKRYRREGIGRIMSILKRNRKYIDFLAENIPRLKKIPSIDPDKPTIIVAGMPQVGKSTLVKKISTASPEIAPYPFTTKNLVLGHIRVNEYIVVQAIDTPGLLDRPLEDRNPIELQAIMALKHLKGVIVYLFDVSKNCYYSVEEQVRVFKDILNRFNKPIVVALNKIDNLDRERLFEVKRYLKETGVDRVFLVSAAKGQGINELLKYIIEVIKKFLQ